MEIYNSYPQTRIVYVKRRRRYTFWLFLFDFIMFWLTCGLWLIVVLIREIFFR